LSFRNDNLVDARSPAGDGSGNSSRAKMQSNSG
jgi:hypothetical protein